MRKRLPALPLLVGNLARVHVQRRVGARATTFGEHAGVQDQDGRDNLSGQKGQYITQSGEDGRECNIPWRKG